ncbi:hypothetical protein Ssi03_77280 [Sphaerisporangium siamense]|uniref:Uncharacterized protein n=1 Tax=Sphaerisporangium siamense TaxID=795645 RepID=A0A7W7D8A9_9ACTN|nr:hypothetical protein [Sphaerisporangium siamense]MBB4700698.1 hypothetical protein [Sphaerisporangium siamense]GII89738.1 hypothetical protein Ssi03_77280 [Sphaerisporangium siamense]
MPMSKWGKTWRLIATGAAGAVLAYGTIAGTDDLFPLGPMVQYAFSVPPDGEIRSLELQADTTAGTRIQIPIEPGYVGVRRAEIEGQLTRYRREPSLLGKLADSHARLRPTAPRLTRLSLVTKVIELKDRRPAATRYVEEVSWRTG